MIKTILFSIILCTASLYAEDDKAFTAYSAAQAAKTKQEQQALYNEALDGYLKIENSSCELSYNIGNCYFQLGEYGLAIYYYYRALTQNPRFDPARSNLLTAISKIGLKNEQQIAFEKPFFSLTPEEKQLFYLGFLIVGFIFFTLFLCLSQRMFKKLAITACLISSLLLADIIWERYLQPVYAVIVAPTPLHKDAGNQYAVIPTKEPMYGERVEVVQFKEESPWIQVKTPNGEEGYVSKDYARIL